MHSIPDRQEELNTQPEFDPELTQLPEIRKLFLYGTYLDIKEPLLEYFNIKDAPVTPETNTIRVKFLLLLLSQISDDPSAPIEVDYVKSSQWRKTLASILTLPLKEIVIKNVKSLSYTDPNSAYDFMLEQYQQEYTEFAPNHLYISRILDQAIEFVLIRIILKTMQFAHEQTGESGFSTVLDQLDLNELAQKTAQVFANKHNRYLQGAEGDIESFIAGGLYLARKEMANNLDDILNYPKDPQSPDITAEEMESWWNLVSEEYSPILLDDIGIAPGHHGEVPDYIVVNYGDSIAHCINSGLNRIEAANYLKQIIDIRHLNIYQKNNRIYGLIQTLVILNPDAYAGQQETVENNQIYLLPWRIRHILTILGAISWDVQTQSYTVPLDLKDMVDDIITEFANNRANPSIQDLHQPILEYIRRQISISHRNKADLLISHAISIADQIAAAVETANYFAV
jgi:hypothetical protein